MDQQKALAGTVTLTNTKRYPFNDSLTTVALPVSLEGCDYAVLTEIAEASGEAGDLVVFGKAQNGFKLAFTGSASRAVVSYRIIGGTCRDCD